MCQPLGAECVAKCCLSQLDNDELLGSVEAISSIEEKPSKDLL